MGSLEHLGHMTHELRLIQNEESKISTQWDFLRLASFLKAKGMKHDSWYRMRILLVDDEGLIRWSLHQALTARGHEVTQAKCGNQALSLLQTHRFDVVITDWKLPGADGFKIIDAARTVTPDIPVIMMSAHGNPELLEMITTHQVNHFLDKPLMVDDVTTLVERLSGSVKA